MGAEQEEEGVAGMSLKDHIKGRDKDQERAIKMVLDRDWRIDNLYWIQDRKTGAPIKFKRNRMQKHLCENLHTRNIVLKSRQLGSSTMIDLMLLDVALTCPGVNIGIIGDTEEKAMELFRTKIQFAYERLPPDWKAAVPVVVDNKSQYIFKNGSSIKAGLNLWGGTYQYVHWSEAGATSVNFPEKAREIVAGSLEAVPKDGMIFIESTARGHGGIFYDMCMNAIKARDEKRFLDDLEYMFHFYGWYWEEQYSVEATWGIPERLIEYFRTLCKSGVVPGNFKLTGGMQRWYKLKEDQLGDEMMREYPSTPDECWRESIEGAYWGNQIREMRKEGRLCPLFVAPEIPVNTAWDLGTGAQDTMAIVFYQQMPGDWIHVVDFLEGGGEGLDYYVAELRKKGYNYGRHKAPHDIMVKELTGKTRLELAVEKGLRFDVVPRVADKMDSIEAVRQLLPRVRIDTQRCLGLIEHMENYRKDWDSTHGCWKSSPAKSEHNHGADSFQCLSMGLGKGNAVRQIGARPWTQEVRRF